MEEQLKAMYPVCTLIKSDGIRCGSPALTGMRFCFQHIGGRLPKPGTQIEPLEFVYPDSHAAIQHNLFLVVQALNEGKIDNRTANTYNRLFRACEANLRKCEAANTSIRLGKDESVQREAESLQQAADPEPATEPDTERDPAPDVDPRANSADEALRRFREWQQSPQGQAFERTYNNANRHLRSPDREVAPNECDSATNGSRQECQSQVGGKAAVCLDGQSPVILIK